MFIIKTLAMKMDRVETSALTGLMIGLTTGNSKLIVLAAAWWLWQAVLNMFLEEDKT